MHHIRCDDSSTVHNPESAPFSRDGAHPPPQTIGSYRLFDNYDNYDNDMEAVRDDPV